MNSTPEILRKLFVVVVLLKMIKLLSASIAKQLWEPAVSL